MAFPREERNRLLWGAVADLNAKVSAAKTTLARQEADLLRKLAVDALETDEARAFLSTIPTVSELVPMSRLIELEQAIGTLEEDD